MKILLLEDDFTLAGEVKKFLLTNHLQCDCVYDGSLLLKQYQLDDYDIAILDINVPGINGFEICRQLREKDKALPIIMLTAFGQLEDKVKAYSLGADDYLVKPFHLEELLLRIRSLLRRKNIPQQAVSLIEVADLIINEDELKVERSGKEILLSPKEFKLLNILAKAGGRVLSKSTIAEQLWDYHIETSQNTIEVYINILRKK